MFLGFYDNVRAEITYPKKLWLDNEKIKSCSNTELRNQRYFWVDISTTTKNGIYKFTARLHKLWGEKLSILNAETGGICDDVRTSENFRGCGLGKSLIKTCFQDEYITGMGGLNPITSNLWNDRNLAREAHENCLTIVYLTCSPYPPSEVPASICKAYLEAAKDLKFHMMFVEHYNENEHYRTMKVTDAIDEFSNGADGPDNFLIEYGKTWFFCKCSPRKKKDCLNM